LSDTDSGPLNAKLGEVLVRLRLLGDSIDVRQSQLEKLHVLFRDDLDLLRQDQRSLDNTMRELLAELRQDLGTLRLATAENSRLIENIFPVIDDLSKPVAEIVALRSRVAGLLLGIGVVGSAILWLGQPIYRWVVEQSLLKR
jgi:signal transduction histidine kinase